MNDTQLLKQFATTRANDALAELVRRHVNWVFSSALRRVRDPAMAEDVTQAVFIALSNQAHKIRPGTAVSTWLFQVTRYASLNAIRSESRRRKHEQKAAAMKSEIEMSLEEWNAFSPDLDELVYKLGADDQRAILLRFYQQQSYSEVAQSLAISEEAARKRVDRAVAKLRSMLPANSISAVAMAVAMEHFTTGKASASVISGVISAATSVGSTAVPASVVSLSNGALHMIYMTKIKFAMLFALIFAGVSIPAAWVVKTYAQTAKQEIKFEATSQPATRPAGRIVTVDLSGTNGAWVHGYYVLAGKEKIRFAGKLPMTFKDEITYAAAVKQDPNDKLQMEVKVAKANGIGGGSFGSSQPRGATDGIYVQILGTGLSGGRVKPAAMAKELEGMPIELNVYAKDGQWVYDDVQNEIKGLPFAAEQKPLLDLISKNIPNATDGFILKVSADEIPGAMLKLKWQNTTGGEQIYQTEDGSTRIQLGPEIFRFFTEPPKMIYLKASELQTGL